MIMRTAPDAARAQREHAKHPHQPFRDPGSRQDGVVLLIVIDDEKPQNQQPRENAADGPDQGMKMPPGAAERGEQENPRGNNAPPTLQRAIVCERFCCADKLVAVSRVRRGQFDANGLRARNQVLRHWCKFTRPVPGVNEQFGMPR